ncbi:hypothetical protein MOUN0_L07822 [Monosporozyma unispora]|nr:hypothetical protein C6P44_004845 [Kazachstania unispora]
MTTIVSSLKRGLRILSGTLYLALILVSIPISFKIGGLYCGLSFTVTLFLLYFISTTLSILARANGNKVFILLTSMLYYFQHSIIASLLYLFLSGFSNIELHQLIENDSSLQLDSLTSILNGTSIGYNYSNSIVNSTNLEANWIFYYFYYKYIVVPWKFILSHSTPFFTLSEGFFTILAIQAIGETNKWLSYEKNSNSWIITSLLFSGGVITGSLYYLYRIYVTPIWELSTQTASLLGFVLSLVGGLSIYGIVSQAGSVIESSLFLAYIVRCIYEISPKLATTATDEILELFKEVWQKHQGNLPIKNTMVFYYYNIILNNIDNVWTTIVTKATNGANSSDSWSHPIFQKISSKDILQFFQPIWKFFKNFTMSVPRSIRELFIISWKLAFESISPAVVINLCFRILVFYSATRIIPSLQRKDYDIKQMKRSRRVMKLIYWYSPCILIAMYAHLILQYSGELKNDLCLWNYNWLQPNNNSSHENIVVDAWSFWNWCNIFWTILIYGSELIGGGSSSNDIS